MRKEFRMERETKNKGEKATAHKNMHHKIFERAAITMMIILQAGSAMTTYAAGFTTGVPELDTAIQGITTILGGIVTGYGIMKLINGVKAWSDANEEMDAARKSQGMQTIISGAICVMVLPILKILGFTL